MNQLYLNVKLIRYCYLVVLLVINSNLIAVESASDDNFASICKNADVYLKYNYTDVSYFKNWSGYKRITSVDTKLVFNNRKGVEDFAFVNFSNFDIKNLRSVVMKAHKADGRIVNIDTSFIYDNIFNKDKNEYKGFPIPGVEPGDTIELKYEYSEYLKNYELKDYINFNNPIPSRATEYSIRADVDLFIRYKNYNGFPEPQIIANDTLLYCLFKMEKIYPYIESQYSCSACELPYMYYSVDEESDEVRSWKDVYNQEFNFITQPLKLDHEKSSYYKKWKKQVIGEAEDSSKYYKLSLLLDNIYENIEIKELSDDEFVKNSGYFLKEKRFDPISIKRLYRQILEDLEIDYWAVFARSKRLGTIDPYYIRKGEYDHIFFAYENSKGILSLLYPHDLTHKYKTSELPTSIYNTKAIIAQPYLTEKIKRRDKYITLDLKMAEVDSVTTKTIQLPDLGSNANYMKQVYYCDVEVKEKKISFNSVFSVSGGISTELRSFYNLLNKDKELNDFYDALSEYEGDDSFFEIDSIKDVTLSDHFPFQFSIKSQGTITNGITFLNDSLISISLNDLIQHVLVESENDSIQLNYYLDYSYSDLFMTIIKFPVKVRLLNTEQKTYNVENEFGKFSFSINNSVNNQLIIQSNYKIKEDELQKEDYYQIKQINDQVREVKNMRILLKLVDS